ncbi:MAG: 2,3,4,5-tetrahydropyridine-2,6-dicarboxylate N-succinyltransferase [Candidatus Cloacimonetes bacterium]|jgi:2,3,4,5-tetrahydropyridine-2-carboxylate N-succinyltransferase|nr:2,3,4,5-tetrahydropyridine-2,6-dicarboxylate N-succinyltransferase [Candidatus Cloacimonadota bacterium]MDD5624670.1 2,3,4,5-tetrahydropyridine-2,6-dicarboxylate N-succinyltransferase [Candidatus Cloacimonadota bacterium]
MNMKDAIIALYNAKPEKYNSADRELYETFIDALDTGKIRACEKTESGWKVNQWVKMGILIGFRMGVLTEYRLSDNKSFFDKDTLPEKVFQLQDQIRIVPGGTSIRKGCYLAAGVTIMPPAFINIGAYVDSGTLIDSHALVGSCAQIGKNVHLSAGAMIGGVLEPVEARPVVIEDDAFIGGNVGIYQGIIVKQKAVIAAGTIITASTLIYDAVHTEFLQRDQGGSFTIPEQAVVVPGSRPLKDTGFQIYCPIIIKYRDAKTEKSVKREEDIHIFD